MQRGLVHAAAWTLATGAAVTLSWFGVHTVLSGTAYDAPRALPLADQVPSSGAGVAPRASSTHRPKPSGTAGHSPSPGNEPSQPSSPAGSGDGTSGGTPSAPPTGAGSGGQVKSYATNGGRVVLDLRSNSAELVSATPNPGWEMQVWPQDTWLRVDFTSKSGHTSVICAWNDHPPIVNVDNHAT
ncbi:hypothetical protein FCH28_11730 [Streptomyces piniterrae]|uniref:Secreted protein n=1 Tax=Streptomyces piniterrae TaxID=2571125 RepID=A0A4U0NN99_9ACTN|nr:hypothetical protein [Streptomyces piniterrae]TJZ55939.1 hypothetical protein FCH28_11730 [Streptomyces piniterrae]